MKIEVTFQPFYSGERPDQQDLIDKFLKMCKTERFTPVNTTPTMTVGSRTYYTTRHYSYEVSGRRTFKILLFAKRVIHEVALGGNEVYVHVIPEPHEESTYCFVGRMYKLSDKTCWYRKAGPDPSLEVPI